MPDDQKDRFGNTLRDAEQGKEKQYFAQRDKELIEKMRRGGTDARTAPAELRCPACGEALRPQALRQVKVDQCPSCGGVWLGSSEFEELARR